jgi:hypothetical protein
MRFVEYVLTDIGLVLWVLEIAQIGKKYANNMDMGERRKEYYKFKSSKGE